MSSKHRCTHYGLGFASPVRKMSTFVEHQKGFVREIYEQGKNKKSSE